MAGLIAVGCLSALLAFFRCRDIHASAVMAFYGMLYGFVIYGGLQHNMVLLPDPANYDIAFPKQVAFYPKHGPSAASYLGYLFAYRGVVVFYYLYYLVELPPVDCLGPVDAVLGRMLEHSSIFAVSLFND